MACSSAPLIGVVADQKIVADNGRPFFGMYRSYLNGVVAAGGLPVLIPLGLPVEALRGIYERLDGLLLTGGGDVDPQTYGDQDAAGLVRSVKPIRDETELQVSRWAVADDVPLFGICRGHQVINVALGGRLYADIPSQVASEIVHDAPDNRPLDFYAHEIAIDPDTRLAHIVGGTTIAVNSRHHQAVREVGRGLVVTARALDGLIEATEFPDRQFVVTVQWHPENMPADPATQALFAALIRAATEHRHAVRPPAQPQLA